MGFKDFAKRYLTSKNLTDLSELIKSANLLPKERTFYKEACIKIFKQHYKNEETAEFMEDELDLIKSIIEKSSSKP